MCIQAGSHTTSNVSVYLIGDSATSDKINLPTEFDVFGKLTESWFLITSCRSVGRLTSVILEIDHNGISPKFFVRNVLIKNQSSREAVICYFQCWISSRLGNFVKAKTEEINNTSLIQSTIELLRGHHMLLSVLFGLQNYHIEDFNMFWAVSLPSRLSWL